LALKRTLRPSMTRATVDAERLEKLEAPGGK
jgi:hypothetical protein